MEQAHTKTFFKPRNRLAHRRSRQGQTIGRPRKAARLGGGHKNVDPFDIVSHGCLLRLAGLNLAKIRPHLRDK
jgi:hypothetical protein